VAKIFLGINDMLQLGNITAVRDWGYAPEYVDAIWRMLTHDVPDDYVISSGVLHSVEEFLDIAFSVVSLNYKDYVRIDEQYFRPPEQVPLVGDSKKARKILGWQPQKKFEDIVKEMVLSDIEILKKPK
jgi:GDPmannose 4,6-dehydratase